MHDTNPSIWFAAPGHVEFRTAAMPTPASGEVLIRTHRTLISTGTELTLFESDASKGTTWSEFAHFPRQVGYSHVGEVVEAGPGVDREWIGKRVASRGCHAAWVVREVTDLRPLPANVSEDEATFTTLAGVVMNGLRRVHLSWGESVAIFGLGIVGHLCARIAAAAGASPVFGIEPSELRLSKLPQQALIHGFTGRCESLLDCVRQYNSGQLVDVVVEATGAANVIPNEIKLIRDQGRLLLLSSPREATSFDFHELCNRRSLTIVGAHGFSQPRVATPDNPWTGKRHGDLFLQWIATGRLSIRELITHHFRFDHAEQAYALLAENRHNALGVIFDWE